MFPGNSTNESLFLPMFERKKKEGKEEREEAKLESQKGNPLTGKK